MVADRAISIADSEGIDAVTIRRLATELGVTPMALYWHFATKDELLAGAADRVLDDLRLPASITGSADETTESWSAELRALLVELVRVLRLHPQLVEQVAHRILASAPGLSLTERALAALSQAGFPATEAAQLAGHALRTAMALAVDDVVDDSGMSSDEREEHLQQKRTMLAALPAEQYPSLVACADAMTFCADPDEFFTLGIDHFLAGVEGLAAQRRH